MKFLHSMLRVSNPDDSVAFFQLLGLEERRRRDVPAGKFTLIFLGVPGDEAEVELTHNWGEEGYEGGRNFGHLAFLVDNIYETCQQLMDNGVTINRPPRDGHMAFVRSPDLISVELLQKGEALPPAEPWASMPNTGGVVMAGAVEVVAVPALSDNYIWMLRDAVSGTVAVVDPGQDSPALDAADERGWRIAQILTTHWHPDHTGGNSAIKAATGAIITAPAEAERVSPVDRIVAEGDRVAVGGLEAEVWEIPAHTAGHIAFYFKAAKMIFVGDTLFAMGCGRLFEGTPDQMFANMQRFAALPDDVLIYCGHEYTLANARFAAHAEPDNAAVGMRLANVTEMRKRGEVTLPTSIAEERATNPFLRVDSVAEFAALRRAKDIF